jgi:hypothetical protein
MASSTQRGYGVAHQKLREHYAKLIEQGIVFCAYPNCRRWIQPGMPWDLAHDPFDRSKYLGPAHVYCNRNTTLEKSLRRPRKVRRVDPGGWL